MKPLLPTFTFLFLFSFQLFSQDRPEAPKHELRAVWLTTAFGLDFPAGETRPKEAEKKLRDIIRTSKKNGLNAVIFQAVARADAMYQSERLPWARRLTGTFGKDPGWDPLAVAIEEAHSLGMDFHAWYNLNNIGLLSEEHEYDDGNIPHVYISNPEWTALDDTHIWLNPGVPAAREWSVENVLEIVENYDVDAVHFDFVRYPTNAFSSDSETMEEFNENNISNLNDWRRDNINQFMRDVYPAVKELKPHVKVGSTPVGHYKSAPWGALWGYSSVFSDSRRWLEEGTNDYLAPQIYWDIGGGDAPEFDYLVHDWLGERFDRHIYVGMAPYKDHVRPEIPEQIDTVRAGQGHGHVYFRYAHISNAPFSDRYENAAIIPTMPWKSTFNPPKPLNLIVDQDSANVTLSWEKPLYGTETDTILRYAIYRVNAPEPPSAEEATADSKNLLAVEGLTQFTDSPEGSSDPYHYYITSLNRNYRESAPVEMSVAVSAPRDDEQTIAQSYSLEQNYPNPFNPATQINFSIGDAGVTTLKVYDMVGREVATLVNESLPSGSHTATFDASRLSSGVYIYVLTSGDKQLSRRMTLVK